MQAAVMPLLGKEKFKKLTDEGYESINNDLRGVYLQGLFNIVKGTPVDEGRARNNWFLSIGAPSGKTTTSKAKGLGALRQLRQMPKRVLNRKIFYTNNLPYIETLEYGGYPDPSKGEKTAGGFSKQAPGGWVRGVLIAMSNKIRAL